jgi:alkyldihydroxyacetonephosphate synthase
VIQRQRKWWGWGYADGGPDERFASGTAAWLRDKLGIDSVSPIVPPRLEDLRLAPPKLQLPVALARFCADTTYDRVSHSYGQAYRDIIRALRGEFPHPPDLVAYPQEEADIIALMDFCKAERIALIPYGGGSSVVGGVEALVPNDYAAVITVDMRNFNRILDVDTASRSARV